MALTPEDVVNKRFNPTKFREGYDQDEVDDFLDEVVVELRRLNQENEELRQRLMAADSRINELQAGGAAPMAAPVAAPAPVAEPAFAQAGVDPSDPANTNNLLQLARRLHEEHVREGMEKRDALIAEGHAAAARVVSEAEQAQRAQLEQAEQASGQLGQLEQERVGLERQIDELRTFEREYRTKLKGYIEGQLRDLETTNALTTNAGAGQPAAVTAGPPPSSSTRQRRRPPHRPTTARSRTTSPRTRSPPTTRALPAATDATAPDRTPGRGRISVRALLLLAAVAVGVYGIDQGSKFLITQNLEIGDLIPVLGEVLQLHYVTNSGAAFSLASGFTWILSIVAVAVIVLIVVFAPRIRSLSWATMFGLVLGGALGNVTDRLVPRALVRSGTRDRLHPGLGLSRHLQRRRHRGGVEHGPVHPAVAARCRTRRHSHADGEDDREASAQPGQKD